MSRYPGTQFRVHDNSQATAIVPVSNVNVNDAVQYLTAFASVKGPEGITLTSGQDFYTRYGTQDNIDFKKYGQPLLQASMNINNGAALLAKRAVLDDAALGNATLAVVLTKYKDGKIEVDEKHKDSIKSISFTEGSGKSKYSLAPIVFSIDNTNDYQFAKSQVNEFKERYNLYKNHISDIVSNENTPNNVFLNKLYSKNENDKILSGFTQSIYYNKDGNVVDITKEGKSNVRKVSSVTTGVYHSIQKTFSSNFTTSDITDKSVATGVPITNEDELKGWTLYKLTKSAESEESDSKLNFEKDTSVSKFMYKTPIEKGVPINRIVTDDDKLQAYFNSIIKSHPEWSENDFDVENANEYVIVVDENQKLNTQGYTSTSRLINDIMVEVSGYIECEYVFPMFTIFDNGRGESIKSIGIEYDSASSVTLKKAIYSLSVYNYSSGTRLEKFAFSLNPYARNNNTGYSFDIESAVNYVSEQISVKTYYASYDALLETLQDILQSTDPSIVENNDILFGHNLNGKYPAFSSYSASNILKRNTYIYDYAHLNIFDNDTITVNAYCDSDNMSVLDTDNQVKIKYYFYNYIRQQKKLLERLEMGKNGYNLAREVVDIKGKDPDNAIPFIVLDDEDVYDNNGETYSIRTVMQLTGQTNGTVITDTDNEVPDIRNNPIVSSNFLEVHLSLKPAKHYTNGVEDKGTYLLSYNTRTLSRSDVINAEKETTGYTGYKFVTSGDTDRTLELVFIPLSKDFMYQEQYRRFFNGEFDKDIFNLDIYFPNALFDANYSNTTKLAIQRLAAFRGDFMCYMDMGIGNINSYTDCVDNIPSTSGGLELTEQDNNYCYVRDMHVAVTCLNYKIRNPYDNRIISVTATYGLSNLYINHFANDVSEVFAGISNGITINNIIEGSMNYIPKIYPTSEMTSLNNIGGVYPSDDETIINEKQLMNDLKVNYGCYYDDRFSIETEYTMNATESEFSYWNNVALVCLMMQAIRKACPAARYQFITANDLTVYKTAVETAMKPWKNKFASLTFKYVQDEAALENKVFYAAIEVVFKPFAQAEIFELTSLNYSTLSENITSI